MKHSVKIWSSRTQWTCRVFAVSIWLTTWSRHENMAIDYWVKSELLSSNDGFRCTNFNGYFIIILCNILCGCCFKTVKPMDINPLQGFFVMDQLCVSTINPSLIPMIYGPPWIADGSHLGGFNDGALLGWTLTRHPNKQICWVKCLVNLQILWTIVVILLVCWIHFVVK